MLVENLGRATELDKHNPRDYDRRVRPYVIRGSFLLPSGKQGAFRDAYAYASKNCRDAHLAALNARGGPDKFEALDPGASPRGK